MARRALYAILGLAGLALGACADREQISSCARLLQPLLPPQAFPTVTAAEPGPADDEVTVRFRSADAAGERTLVCRFSGRSGPRSERLSVAAIALDGAPLGFVQIVLLNRWLGRPTPLALLAPRENPPWPVALHLAYLAQQLLNGIVVGAVIALVAVGYTLVYGIARQIQFAYGELVTIGALTTAGAYAALHAAGAATPASVLGLALPFVLALAALQGWAMDRAVFRPLRFADTQSPLIAAIGLSIFLQEFARLAQGVRGRWMPKLLPQVFELFRLGGFSVTVTATQLAILATAVAFSGVLGALLAGSAWGRSYRAVTDDARMAALLGLDVDRTVAAAYAAGAGFAALAGVALVANYGQVDTGVGFSFGFKALTAAVLGGIGSFEGALLGGLLIGLVEALCAAYLGNAWRDAAVFVVLALVLLFRPEGILGRPEPPMPLAGPGAALRAHRVPPSRAAPGPGG